MYYAVKTLYSKMAFHIVHLIEFACLPIKANLKEEMINYIWKISFKNIFKQNIYM